MLIPAINTTVSLMNTSGTIQVTRNLRLEETLQKGKMVKSRKNKVINSVVVKGK